MTNAGGTIHLKQFRAVHVISDTGNRQMDCCELLSVAPHQVTVTGRANILFSRHCVENFRTADLLVLDMDDLYPDEISYMAIISNVYLPGLPIVLVTRHEVNDSLRRRYQRSAGVLDVVRLADSTTTLAAV